MSPRRAACGLVVALAACQPPPGPIAAEVCPAEPPAAGTVVVGPLPCSDVIPPRGEGGAGDAWLANASFRAIVRHPVASVSLAGVDGATVADVAPWGYRDRVHEIAPLVAGGWLDIDTFTVEDDGIRVTGTVVSLPDRPAEALGERRDVMWRIDPDGPWLIADGADGFYVHPAGAAERLGDVLWTEGAVIGPVGGSFEDLGGAIRYRDTDTLLITDVSVATTWLYAEGSPVSGVAPDAEQVVVFRGGDVVARLPVADDGTFAGLAPDDANGVRAEAGARAPSPTVAPGEGLELALGGGGAIVVSVTGVDPTLPVGITWRDEAGRKGVVALAPGGGVLHLGEGRYSLDVDAGPAALAATVEVEVAPDAVVIADVALTPAFTLGPRVLAATSWTADRSRRWRGTDDDALSAAAAVGARYVVLAPEDDIADAEPTTDLLWRNGSRLVGPDWEITWWPASADGDQPAHGAPSAEHLAPIDALAAVWGGPGSSPFTTVDVAWLEDAGAPYEARPRPDFVRLAPPGSAGPDVWGPYFAWLDRLVPIVPVGPFTWVTVDDPARVAEVDVEDGLVRGRVVATTGPLIELDVGGAGPGDVVRVPTLRRAVPVRVRVGSEAGRFDHVAVIGDGGVEIARWDDVVTPFEASAVARLDHWLVAVAWDEDGDAFAATGPVWGDVP